MHVYYFEGEHREEGETLLRQAVSAYGEELGIGPFSQEKVRRGEKGKPYFVNLPVRFSISHTGNLWACMTAQEEVGLDIQTERRLDHLRLAERFFSPDEQAYVRANGASGFFEIWVRKEACVKYFGVSLAEAMGRLSVVSNGGLQEKVKFEGNSCFVSPLSWPERTDTWCAWCSGRKGTVQWRKMIRQGHI